MYGPDTRALLITALDEDILEGKYKILTQNYSLLETRSQGTSDCGIDLMPHEYSGIGTKMTNWWFLMIDSKSENGCPSTT